MKYAQHGTLGYRHINALSWRVASELARRDNSLYIALTDGGSAAHADALVLGRSGQEMYQARRCGSGLIAGNLEVPWDEALDMRSAREIAIRLEKAIGLHLPEKSPPTSRRAIGYHLLASMLENTIGDSRYWSVSEGSGGPLDRNSGPTWDRLNPGEGTRHFLRCEDELVCEVDNFGILRIDGQLINLLPRYRELGGSLHRLIADTLAARLQ